MPKETTSAKMTPQKMHPENFRDKEKHIEKCIKEKQENFQQSIKWRQIVWLVNGSLEVLGTTWHKSLREQ